MRLSALRLVLVTALSTQAGSCPNQPSPIPVPAGSTAKTPSERPAESPKAVERIRDRIPAPTMSYLGADWLTRPERIEEEQPDKMLDALHIRPGQNVADIGAGVGYHAIRLSKRVGPEGRVYATDIQEEMLTLLRQNLKDEKISNVIPVLSGDLDTGLPKASIDVVLMVDVYHELSNPERFLAGLKLALRPEARVVLVEFRGEDPNVPIREEHKMTAAQVIRELGQSGFVLVERQELLPWQHILIFREGTTH